jgi:hypothetical protein
MARGRPTEYDEAIAGKICDAIIEGAALYKVCEKPDFPGERTVYQWLEKHPEFAQQYARARELQQDRAADEIIEIADNEPDPNKARIRVDARKWRASKLAPKKYGDRVDMNLSGSVQTMPQEALDARITELLGKAGVAAAARGDGTEKDEE